MLFPKDQNLLEIWVKYEMLTLRHTGLDGPVFYVYLSGLLPRLPNCTELSKIPYQWSHWSNYFLDRINDEWVCKPHPFVGASQSGETCSVRKGGILNGAAMRPKFISFDSLIVSNSGSCSAPFKLELSLGSLDPEYFNEKQYVKPTIISLAISLCG